jgi:hypothetical protein
MLASRRQSAPESTENDELRAIRQPLRRLCKSLARRAKSPAEKP